ncbi:hypothetical protein ACLKA6_011658 [Drosophila palustris]
MASECSKLTLTTPEQPPRPIPRRPTYASQVKTDNNSNNNDKAVADDNRIDIGGLTLGGLLDLPARR